MLQPTPPGFTFIPGTESWGERYGVIGVVATIALLALWLGVRALLAERREDRQQVNALNAKLVETVQQGHREALGLVADLQKAHDLRYSALLERHIGETGKYADTLREQAAATTAALAGLVKKISSRGPE